MRIKLLNVETLFKPSCVDLVNGLVLVNLLFRFH